MAHQFRETRRVEFSDTDMAGIAHFSNLFRFMEACEHAFFTSNGLLLHGEKDGVMFGWVRVHASCDYSSPARYLDRLETELRVVKKSRSSLHYEFVFRVVGTDDPTKADQTFEPREIARGAMKTVYVSKDGPRGAMKSFPIPSEVDARIDVARSESGGASSAEPETEPND